MAIHIYPVCNLKYLCPGDRRLSFRDSVLALGAEQKGNFSLFLGGALFSGPEFGNLRNPAEFKNFEKDIKSISKSLSGSKSGFPGIIACDLHPEYMSTKLAMALADGERAKGRRVRLIQTQHHHAHVASCMVENGLKDKVIGVAFDGTGYGSDGHIWGGEFLVADYCDFKRAAHLAYVAMPGSDKAAEEVTRMAFSYIYSTYGEDYKTLKLKLSRVLGRDRCLLYAEMIKKKINTPLTSSVGRLFDAVSGLIGLKETISHEGEAAIELEKVADIHCSKRYRFVIKEDDEGRLIIEFWPMIKEIVSDLKKRESTGSISGKFHNTLAEAVMEACISIRKRNGINKVALTGGVFQNELLMIRVKRRLNDSGFSVYAHSKGKCSDIGLSIGQAVIARTRKKRSM
ncbi:MAG: carbamoyltransferase HypF [Candidatus Omnitrophica bacterium]|nr:carbamoyltransferase HypF [Candidatus Omnitrophota bacterium]